VPAPAAWFESSALADEEGRPATLGLLQPYLAGSSDGWQLALDHIARGQDFTEEARALGRATAEVHTALAEALPVSVLRRPQIEHLTTLMIERLDATTLAVPALRPHRDALATAFEALAELGEQGVTWPAQRIHGDFHLGQVLRGAADGRWTMIDFEGEPSRPLAERRRPQPIARDLAGILRSFDYAARTGGAEPGWAERNCAAFLDGYAGAADRDPRQDEELLLAYETDKAVYEVLYEARHRPDWLQVPLAAIHRLTTAHA
jgi:maltokinase